MRIKSLARRIPVLRDLGHEVAPYQVGSVIENRLGYQVVRVLLKNLALRVRFPPSTAGIEDSVRSLARDGIVIFPDYLPAAAFRLVREEFERIQPEVSLQPFRRAEAGRLHSAKYPVSSHLDRFPATTRHLVENLTIRRIVAAALRRRSLIRPFAEFTVYRMVDATAPDNDIENVLHADLHYPTFKAFYYLSAVDSDNGAFVYVKGSHKLTMERLAHEYGLSVRTARLRDDQSIPDTFLAVRGQTTRNIIPREVLDRLNASESQICGGPNTLVIANNMGFHRRGEFHGSKPREVLLLNFRYLKGEPRPVM